MCKSPKATAVFRASRGDEKAASEEAAETCRCHGRGVLAGQASYADGAKETFSFCGKKKASLDSPKEKVKTQ
jgi:hypothetical protein